MSLQRIPLVMHRIAARISIGAVIAFTVIHASLAIARQAMGSSYPLLYVPTGGSACALIALIAGIIALAGGKSRLGSRDRQFALIGIVAGLSYFAYAAFILTRG